MNSVLEKKENNKAIFSMEIESKDFDKAINSVYLKNRKHFAVPGFRKGRVPRQIIEMNYGKEIFFEDALNEILPEAYENAIEELELEPVDIPNVDVEDIEKGKNIKVKVEVVIKPEVKLGDYKGIEVEEVKNEITDEDVDKEIETVREMNGRIVPVEDRPAKEKDTLDIDFKGFVDGEEFEGGSAENYELVLGSESFIPGFEDQLIGSEKGAEVEVNVTFPEDYQEESLAGKEAKFEVIVNEIKEKELPKLDDEFVIDVSEFDTLDEYKNDIKEKLEKSAKENAKISNQNNIIDKVVEDAEMEIPEVMVENQIENELNEFAYNLQMQGIDMEQYFQLTGSSLDGFKEEIRPVAEKRVRADLVLDAITKAEKIEATEEDLDKKLEEMAEQYGQEDLDKFKKDMKKGDLDYLYKGISREKTVDFLMENTKFI